MINKMRKLNVKRGEIWIANLPKIEGTSIQWGTRPVIVWSNDEGCNQYSPIISVFPVTSKTKNNIPTHVLIGRESGLQQESIVLVEQPMSIDKGMLLKKVGECTNEVMKKINIALLIQAGLYNSVKNLLAIQKKYKELVTA